MTAVQSQKKETPQTEETVESQAAERIAEGNNYPDHAKDFVLLVIGGQVVGRLPKEAAVLLINDERTKPYCSLDEKGNLVFTADRDHAENDTPEKRTAVLNGPVLEVLAENYPTRKTKENLDVAPEHGSEPVAGIDKTLARVMGIKTRGVMIIVYAHGPNGEMYVLKSIRSKETFNYPGDTDAAVGGAVPNGETPLKTAIREAGEEMGLPAEQVRGHLQDGGSVTWNATAYRENKKRDTIPVDGSRDEVDYIYTMEFECRAVKNEQGEIVEYVFVPPGADPDALEKGHMVEGEEIEGPDGKKVKSRFWLPKEEQTDKEQKHKWESAESLRQEVIAPEQKDQPSVKDNSRLTFLAFLIDKGFINKNDPKIQSILDKGQVRLASAQPAAPAAEPPKPAAEQATPEQAAVNRTDLPLPVIRGGNIRLVVPMRSPKKGPYRPSYGPHL